jgi:hypothetical protein
MDPESSTTRTVSTLLRPLRRFSCCLSRAGRERPFDLSEVGAVLEEDGGAAGEGFEEREVSLRKSPMAFGEYEESGVRRRGKMGRKMRGAERNEYDEGPLPRKCSASLARRRGSVT